MASVVSRQEHHNQEAAGEITLELVAVRYVGSKTLYDVTAHLTPQGWPGAAALDGGPTPSAKGAWNFALVPDQTLSALEGRPDIEVVYAADQQADFAAAVLEAGLPENVFGRDANRDLQRRVFDAVGIQPTAQGGPFEDQLRKIAGESAPDEEESSSVDPEDDSQRVASTFAEKYKRGELGEICKELRSDPSDFNLRENASKTERAEYIATFSRQERAAAVEAALGAEDDGDEDDGDEGDGGEEE